jgi:hypothetical protein
MSAPVELYSDRIVRYLRDPEHRSIELRWLGEANAMSEQQFRGAIERLASLMERDRPPNVLVDMARLEFSPADDFEQWRQTHIIPRYNKAGVTKFAFILAEGAPNTVETGTRPAVEGSAVYPTGYFSTRDGAIAWFTTD